jgi:hypothetical protein
VIEARLDSRPPVAVTCRATSVHQAIDGATRKLLRTVESDLGRLRHHGAHGADSLRNRTVPTEIL